MVQSVFGWTFDDVQRFLREHDFVRNHIKGSHHFFAGFDVDGTVRIVCVPFHGSHGLKPKTLKGIIAQSGIPKEEWLM